MKPNKHIPEYYLSPEWIKLRTFVVARDGGICQYCGNDRGVQADHVYPRHAGGKDDPKNLKACCASCNKILGGKIFKDFAEKRSYIVSYNKKLSKNRKRKTQMSRIKRIWENWNQ